MAIGVAVYFAYGKRHSLVGRRAGRRTGATQEELKATWHAERGRRDDPGPGGPPARKAARGDADAPGPTRPC